MVRCTQPTAVTLLLATSVSLGVATALAQSNNDPGGSTKSHAAEQIKSLGDDPSGTYTYSSWTLDCDPCFLGFGAHRFDFALTKATDVRVDIMDCCTDGDRFEARVNDKLVDDDLDGDFINHEEDCIFARQTVSLPAGSYGYLGTVTLNPGAWSIRVRNVHFQCDSDTVPLTGCPAGYWVKLHFTHPTFMPCADLPRCGVTPNAADVDLLANPHCLDQKLTCGQISSYGSGCSPSGPGSVPGFQIWGCPSSLGVVTLTIFNGTPSASSFLVVGSQQAAVPMGGECTLSVLPLPPLVTGPFPLNALGEFQLQLAFPAGLPAITLNMQAFIDEGVGAFSNTHGIEMTIIP